MEAIGNDIVWAASLATDLFVAFQFVKRYWVACPTSKIWFDFLAYDAYLWPERSDLQVIFRRTMCFHTRNSAFCCRRTCTIPILYNTTNYRKLAKSKFMSTLHQLPTLITICPDVLLFQHVSMIFSKKKKNDYSSNEMILRFGIHLGLWKELTICRNCKPLCIMVASLLLLIQESWNTCEPNL